MIFLNPAILFGLLAAAIPVLIHLLNLRKLKRIEFSTLSFLKELQKNKIRKIKIRQWLLLALRVMLILLLVTAFARPTLKGVAIGGTTSAAKTTAIFILDDTFSMSAVTPEGSYFNRSKEIINQLLNNLQEGDEASLITVSDADNTEPSVSGSLGEFSKRVNDIQISYSTGTLNDAVVKAAALLGQSKNFNKEIYIISDYQKGRIYEDERSLSDLGELLNENVKIYSFNLPEKEIFNAGIDDLRLNTSIFRKDNPVSFDLTVTNNSKQIINNGVISLFINGERSAQHSFTLEGLSSQTITIESVVKHDGIIEVAAELEDDDFLHDNKRYISFNIPEEIPVGIFASSIADVSFIETALKAYESGSPLKINVYNLSQFSSLNPEQFSTIIICGHGSFNSQRLNTYLENGGGLIVLPGSGSTPETFNALLNDIGIPAVNGASGSFNQVQSFSSFENITIEHPLFHDIFSGNEKQQIESPEIYFSMNARPGISGTTIISLNNGSSFLSEYKKESGRILLYSSAPVLSWSNFPLKSIFPPLINRSVYYLSSRGGSESFIAGTDLHIYLGRGITPPIRLLRPGNDEEFVTLSGINNDYIEIENSAAAGIYSFFSNNNAVKKIAVNTDPKESIAEHLNSDTVKEYLDKVSFKGHFYSFPANDDPAELILQARFGSELWKHFLIAALLLAIVEMAVARNAKKDLVTA